MMRSKLREIEKNRDKYDVKYETSRFEAMVGFGTESAFEAKQRELEEIGRSKLIHDQSKLQINQRKLTNYFRIEKGLRTSIGRGEGKIKTTGIGRVEEAG